VSHVKDKGGYPVIGFEGHQVRMNRHIWMLMKGKKPPSDLLVLHSCDTRDCINIEHLRLGTHNDNMKDMMDRGRFAYLYGEKARNVKLTEKEVVEIKNSYLSRTALAKLYDVCYMTISKIQRGRSWTTV
jgi:hypothetical protein